MKLENLEVVEIKEVQKGTSKAGKEYQTLTFVCKNTETYNNTFAFEMFGEEKITNFLKFTKVGYFIDVDFNIDCREYNGKWFTKLSYWKSFKAEGNTPQSHSSSAPASFPEANPEEDSKLPF